MVSVLCGIFQWKARTGAFKSAVFITGRWMFTTPRFLPGADSSIHQESDG